MYAYYLFPICCNTLGNHVSRSDIYVRLDSLQCHERVVSRHVMCDRCIVGPCLLYVIEQDHLKATFQQIYSTPNMYPIGSSRTGDLEQGGNVFDELAMDFSDEDEPYGGSSQDTLPVLPTLPQMNSICEHSQELQSDNEEKMNWESAENGEDDECSDEGSDRAS